MIDHTEYMELIVNDPFPIIQSSTRMSEQFVFRKHLAEKYLKASSKDRRNDAFKIEQTQC